MNKITLYQKARTGKIQQWSIWVEPKGDSGHPEIWIEHGQVEGKKQLTHDVISKGVNAGKANETTTLEQAMLMAGRKITKQREKGYRDTVEELNVESTIDFTQCFPKELCFYKPKTSIDDKKIKKLETSNSAVYTVKRDGMMHIVRKTEAFGIEIYSRRMDLVTDKYPHLIESLNNMLPNNTILLGEIVLFNGDEDNFNGVSQICRSDAEKAIERQNELGRVSYYIFDVAFADGKNLLTTLPYIERRRLLDTFLAVITSTYIKGAEVINKPHNEALQEIRDRNLEGLVIWDAQGKMEDGAAFTHNGKSYRPNVLWKSKPRYELDGIVRFDPKNGIGEYGTGKNNGKMKSVFLYQLDDDGNEIFISKVGGGFSDAQREFLTTAEYPRVFEILYDSIQAGTGSLRFPVFSRDRTSAEDKSVEECLMSDNIRQARKGENK